MFSAKQPNMTVELALLVLLSFLWGASFTLIKIAVDSIPPATIVAARISIATVVLLLVTRLWGYRLKLWGKQGRPFLVQGLLQSALPFTLISWGERHIDSGLAGLLNSTPPLFVFLFGFAALRREANVARKLFGVLLGFAGVLLILGVDVLRGLGSEVLAQVAVTGASVSYAFAALYGRRFAGQPAVVTATRAMAMASLLMLPLACALDRPWELALSTTALVAVLLLALFSTALAMIIFFRLLRTIGSLGTTSGSYLRAGFSVLLGVGLLGEPLTWSLASGLVLILAGVAIVNGQLRLPCQSPDSTLDRPGE